MPFLDMDLSDTKEPELLKADEEYQFRVVSVKEGTNKNGNPYVMPCVEPIGHPYTPLVFIYLEIPHKGMDERTLNNSKIKWSQFLNAIGLDQSFELEDILYQEFYGIAGIQDGDRGPQNVIKQFVRGR